MKRTAFLIGMILIVFVASAQNETVKKDTIDLLPVEVKATRASNLAPFTKTNLSKKDLDKLNLGQDLPFLLNQTPSVVINSDAGAGIGYTGLRIRGTDLTRINVTLNGIPYNDPESGGVYFVDLPDFASSVSSLQIQRGVGTSSNGGGAFGATINMSTNEVNLQPYADIMNSVGSFNTLRHTIKAGTGLIDDHFTLDARLSKISSDGFIDRASSHLQSYYLSGAWIGKKSTIRFNTFAGKEKTFQAWSGIPEFKLHYNADSLLTHYYNNIGAYYFNEADSLNLFNADSRKYNVYLYPNQTDNYKQDHYQLFFNHNFNPQLALSTAFFLTHGEGYYEEYKFNQKFSNYGLPNVTIGNTTIKRTDLVRQLWLKNNLYGGVFSLQFKNNKLDYTTGGSWNRFDGQHYGNVIWAQQAIAKDYQFYHYPALKDDGNIYGKLGYKATANLYLMGDVQYRHVHHKIDGTRKFPTLHISKNFNFFNPKLGANYTLKPFKVYASYALSNKEPNRTDFETGTIQAPKAERLHDFEMGLEHKDNKLNYSLTGYYMLYKDQLVLTGKLNDVGDPVRFNVPNSYRLGVEAAGGIQINHWMDVQANLTLSRNKLKNYSDYTPRYDGNFDFVGYENQHFKNADISFSPWLTAFGALNLQPIKNLVLSINNKAVSKQYLDNTNSDYKKLDGYFVQDVQAQYVLTKKIASSIELIAQVNNLWNRKYETNGYTYSYFYETSLIKENFYYPMAGTHFMVALNLHF